MIYCNSRILKFPMTGVQRYTLELLSRFNNKVVEVNPNLPLNGIKGHLWEQILLPYQVRFKGLWSPSNTGPLSVSKQVVTIHDLATFDNPEWVSKNFRIWYQFLLPKLAHRVQHIITISEFTKLKIMEHTGVDHNKISVIYNGVDSRFIPRDISSVSHVIRKLGIPSPRYFLSLGSLEPRKNLERLLSAWAIAQNEIDEDIYLVIAGSKGNSQIFGSVELNNIVSRVFYTGHISDEFLPSLYSGAMAFAYISLYEGFGLPPLEAMSCGVPILSSNTTSLPEVVGNAGLMVDPLNIEEIANGLVILSKNSILRGSMVSRGLSRARLLNWDTSAKLTWDVLTTYL